MAVTSRELRNTRVERRDVHWISMLLTAMLYGVAILVVAVLVQRGLTWGQRRFDDMRYGMPRTVQVSGVVGFGDSTQAPTHLIAMNIDGQVSVLVLPAGDSSRLTALAGPYLVGDDGPYVVPHPALLDVNGDKKEDLVVTVRGEDLVYLNRGDKFEIITPEERTQLMEHGNGQ